MDDLKTKSFYWSSPTVSYNSYWFNICLMFETFVKYEQEENKQFGTEGSFIEDSALGEAFWLEIFDLFESNWGAFNSFKVNLS